MGVFGTTIEERGNLPKGQYCQNCNAWIPEGSRYYIIDAGLKNFTLPSSGPFHNKACAQQALNAELGSQSSSSNSSQSSVVNFDAINSMTAGAVYTQPKQSSGVGKIVAIIVGGLIAFGILVSGINGCSNSVKASRIEKKITKQYSSKEYTINKDAVVLGGTEFENYYEIAEDVKVTTGVDGLSLVVELPVKCKKTFTKPKNWNSPWIALNSIGDGSGISVNDSTISKRYEMAEIVTKMKKNDVKVVRFSMDTESNGGLDKKGDVSIYKEFIDSLAFGNLTVKLMYSIEGEASKRLTF